jgi:hypothetical protein
LGRAARSSGGDPHDQPPPETLYIGFRIISVPPRPFGSGNCDHALFHRYPLLSLVTPNLRVRARIRAKARTRNKDARRTNGGRRVQPIVGFPTSIWLLVWKKRRKRRGKLFGAAARALAFFDLVVSAPPPALEATEDLDKDKSRDGRSGNDLGRGLRDATAGSTSDHVWSVFSLVFPLVYPSRPKSRGS